MISNEVALALFVACNGVRSIAYLPQIVQLARDRDGAVAVSCLTWGLFTFANASTVAYALIVTGDLMIALTFSLNMLCCLSIVSLAACKRRSTRNEKRDMRGISRAWYGRLIAINLQHRGMSAPQLAGKSGPWSLEGCADRRLSPDLVAAVQEPQRYAKL